MEISISVLPWVLSILFGLTVVGVALALNRKDQVAAVVARTPSTYTPPSGSILLRLFGGTIRALGELFSLLPIENARRKTETRLLQAGTPGGFSADQYFGTRVIAAVVATLIGMYFDFEFGFSLAFTILFFILGSVYPDIWLSGVVEKRQRRIFRDLPDALDTLRLAVDAGLDLGSALHVVVAQGRQGPLVSELKLVDREMAVGVTRRDALSNMATRIGMTDINAFVIALNQADQLGASIGPLLKVQAETARTRRWQLAETLVNKMPMKMLGPLVLLVFPSSFIILFTPLIIQYMQAN